MRVGGHRDDLQLAAVAAMAEGPVRRLAVLAAVGLEAALGAEVELRAEARALHAAPPAVLHAAVIEVREPEQDPRPAHPLPPLHPAQVPCVPRDKDAVRGGDAGGGGGGGVADDVGLRAACVRESREEGAGLVRVPRVRAEERKNESTGGSGGHHWPEGG